MSRYIDTNEHPKAKACLEEIDAVLKRHGFALSHEDWHGAFLLREAKPAEARLDGGTYFVTDEPIKVKEWAREQHGGEYLKLDDGREFVRLGMDRRWHTWPGRYRCDAGLHDMLSRLAGVTVETEIAEAFR